MCSMTFHAARSATSIDFSASVVTFVAVISILRAATLVEVGAESCAIPECVDYCAWRQLDVSVPGVDLVEL